MGIEQVLSRAHRAAMHIRAVLHAEQAQQRALQVKSSFKKNALH
jgi:hypothetical protein